MRIPIFRNRPDQLGAVVRVVTRQAPHTLTVVLHRAQPAAVTIARLTVTALFAYLIALNVTSTPRPVLAPLTALLVVQVSLYQTLRSALTKVASVIAGVLLAILLSDTLGFTWWTLTVIIAMALIIGYALRLGSNILEVPVSAMLILATSSVASQRIIDTIIGAGAGLVSGFLLVFPQVESAEDAIQGHCGRMADLLDRMVTGLCDESVRNEAGDWLRQARVLVGEIGRVDEALRRAEESIRLNPRRMTLPLSTVILRGSMETIEHEAIALRVFTRSLADSSQLDDRSSPIDHPEVRGRLAAELAELSAALRTYGEFAVKHQAEDHERLEAQLDQHLRAAKDRQDELNDLLNSDPRAEPAGWALRGEMISHLDRLRRELGRGKPMHTGHSRRHLVLRPGSPSFRRRRRDRLPERTSRGQCGCGGVCDTLTRGNRMSHVGARSPKVSEARSTAGARMYAPPGSSSIRGREREWDLILELLGNARRGKSGTLLLEGEPGMGKSVLLADAADAASAQGFSLATSVGEKLGWPHGDARGWLEELGSAGPVLISIDDLHYAAPVTLHALRTLPGLLSSYPFSWILARSSHDVGDRSDLLFEVLQREGATRVRLPPLSDEAQAAMATDVLGAAPDGGLAECAACAGGNPFVLRELLVGLSEENAILVADGRASLVSQRIPDRFRAAMRDRLKRLAVPTRHFLAAGAILGASFRLEDVAEMLGESPASLLAPVEEALAANFVVTSPDAIAFQHDLLWRVVRDELPQHVLEALHRQAGEMLLKRGGSAVPAARHLLAAVRRGDPVVLGALDLAVTEALHSSPRAAAEIAVRTLELTSGADRERTARTVTAVRALTTAGMWQAAGELAQPALAVPMDARSSAPLRCALASLHAMSDRQAEALIEAESIMADPDVTPGDRDEAKIVLLQALTALRDGQQMEQVATSVLAQQGGTRGEIFVAAQLVRALVAWDAGRVAESLDLAAEAMRNEVGELAHRFQPEVFLASRLIDIGNLAAARAVMMNPPGRLGEPIPVSWCAASPDILRARLALAAGNLDDAAAEAESALVYSDAVGMDLHSLIARSVLAAVALRRGDLHTAVRQIDSSPAPVHHFVSAYEAVRADLVWAQVEEAQHGPGAALARLARLYQTVYQHQYPLMSDPVSAPWLVRVALAAGDRRQAEAVTTVMAGLHQRNPAVPVFRACADHARGVLDADRACLEQAVALHEDSWARASAAEDLGALLAAAGSRNEAVKVLGESLEGYERTGAERGAARIRRRLRRLGVRRGRWTSVKRPPTGWESLTDTDRSISKLVAEGMTNQQIADQLYISIHTVAYHLRQVFRKLGVRSRVELARIALERTEDGDPVRPDKALFSEAYSAARRPPPWCPVPAAPVPRCPKFRYIS